MATMHKAITHRIQHGEAAAAAAGGNEERSKRAVHTANHESATQIAMLHVPSPTRNHSRQGMHDTKHAAKANGQKPSERSKWSTKPSAG